MSSRLVIKVCLVLKDNGTFLYITFRQSHSIQPLLNPDGIWDLEMQVLGREGSFEYWRYVIKKNS